MEKSTIGPPGKNLFDAHAHKSLAVRKASMVLTGNKP